MAISNILSKFDDKIENNQQINNTLEAIGQALFKQWFIDFEFPNEDGKPYKSNGGEMVYNEELEKEIPIGWKVTNFGEIIEITSGKRPDEKSEIKNEEYTIPLVGASKVMGYTKKSIYEKETIVTGRVGTHGIVQRFNEPIFPSDNTLVITSQHYEYVYQYLLRVNYSVLNIGSTQPLITQTSIKKLKVILPVDNILVLFERICNTLYKKYYENNKTSMTLLSIRDTLLPKLMSGKIRAKIPAENGEQ